MKTTEGTYVFMWRNNLRLTGLRINESKIAQSILSIKFWTVANCLIAITDCLAWNVVPNGVSRVDNHRSRTLTGTWSKFELGRMTLVHFYRRRNRLGQGAHSPDKPRRPGCRSRSRPKWLSRRRRRRLQAFVSLERHPQFCRLQRLPSFSDWTATRSTSPRLQSADHCSPLLGG